LKGEIIETIKVITRPFWLAIGIYTALLGGLYASTFSWMLTEWQKDDFNYCYLVPLILVYLFWERRQEISRQLMEPSWKGMLPLCLGLAFFWLGELGGEYFTLYISFWLVLLGICWVHLGWKMIRTLSFPFLMILGMFPPPSFVASKLSFQLKLLSSTAGVKMMHLAGMSAFREGNVIDIGFTQLQVVDACSGLRYLFPIILLGILLGYFYRLNTWRWFVLVFSTLPVIVFINGVRIALTGYLYQFFGSAVAEGFFHDFAGWFTFMVALALLLPEIQVLKRIPIGRRGESFEEKLPEEIARPARANRSGKAVFLSVVVLLGLTLGTSYGVEFREKIPAQKPFSNFPTRIQKWEGEAEYLSQDYIEALDLSDHVIINYRNRSGKLVNFYVAYYESQRKGESIHSPTTCLPGGGWVFQESGVRRIDDPGLPERMRVRRAFMTKDGHRQLSYYWFLQRGRVLTSLYQLKLFAFWDALTKQRTDGALVRLITPVAPDEKVQDADERLENMTRQLMPILEEFIPGADI
jgi:exosortase D (VPLPA-CTERM-specific)